MKIGILGTGNGGTALAAEISQKGYEVIIGDLPDFQENINFIKRQGGVYFLHNDRKEFKEVKAVENLGDVFDNTEIVFISAPAYGIKRIARESRSYIKKGHKIILIPGSVGGALEFKKELGIDYLDEEIIVAETSTLPYAARLIEKGFVAVYLYVKRFMIAALPSTNNKKIVDFIKTIWPVALEGKNVLETSLSCGNPVIHPPITLLNTGLIERTKGNFKFYAEGVTKGVGNLIKALDEERLSLGKALNIDLLSEPEQGVKQGYMEKADYWEGYSESLVFKNIMAPPSLNYRFITEDVAYGLVFWSSLGKLLGIETPVIDAVIKIASVVVGKNLRQEGTRTVESLGLTKELIKRL